MATESNLILQEIVIKTCISPPGNSEAKSSIYSLRTPIPSPYFNTTSDQTITITIIEHHITIKSLRILTPHHNPNILE